MCHRQQCNISTSCCCFWSSRKFFLKKASIVVQWMFVKTRKIIFFLPTLSNTHHNNQIEVPRLTQCNSYSSYYKPCRRTAVAADHGLESPAKHPPDIQQAPEQTRTDEMQVQRRTDIAEDVQDTSSVSKPKQNTSHRWLRLLIVFGFCCSLAENKQQSNKSPSNWYLSTCFYSPFYT